ncbi:MAG TPA: 30S ribosomal protein S6 [Firmicutes bacterium]|nr:30S ribosomal protein S6 [Bacillota bacterium]
MRNYEAMYVLRPDMDEEQINAAVEKFSGIIAANGGEVTKVDHWGKRRLAFEVQKLREGYYVLCYFTADADLPKELERNFKISDEVIRFLVVREGE